MSATTSTKYDEVEGSFEGRIRMYITRTYSVEIDIHSEDCVDCDEKVETFRCNLAPIKKWKMLIGMKFHGHGIRNGDIKDWSQENYSKYYQEVIWHKVNISL